MKLFYFSELVLPFQSKNGMSIDSVIFYGITARPESFNDHVFQRFVLDSASMNT